VFVRAHLAGEVSQSLFLKFEISLWLSRDLEFYETFDFVRIGRSLGHAIHGV